MERRLVASLLAAALVVVLFVPIPVAAADTDGKAAVSAVGGNADTIALDRFRSTVASSGLARTDTEGVLDQSTRASVYETIRDSPGATLSDVADAVGVTKSTVRYHARVLREAGLIEMTQVAGALRLAPADADVGLAAVLGADATRAVLDAVSEHEPASVRTLAEATDRAPSTVSHHLSSLEERGLIERERVGEAVVTTLTPATRSALSIDSSVPADD